jgi:general secretion pathway protein G
VGHGLKLKGRIDTVTFPFQGSRGGFTLIELLIVVAIIAILAAIAVPNFLEAQTRAKVSRALADMRSLNTAIEAYRVDTNRYPPRPITPPDLTMSVTLPPPLGAPPSSADEGRPRSFSFITTPVAYITSIPPDPFEMTLRGEFNTFEYFDNLYTSVFFVEEVGRGGFTLFSNGPDTAGGWGAGASGRGYPDDGLAGTARVVYDSTNGTISFGNVYRFNHNATPPPFLERAELPIAF